MCVSSVNMLTGVNSTMTAISPTMMVLTLLITVPMCRFGLLVTRTVVFSRTEKMTTRSTPTAVSVRMGPAGITVTSRLSSGGGGVGGAKVMAVRLMLVLGRKNSVRVSVTDIVITAASMQSISACLLMWLSLLRPCSEVMLLASEKNISGMISSTRLPWKMLLSSPNMMLISIALSYGMVFPVRPIMTLAVVFVISVTRTYPARCVVLCTRVLATGVLLWWEWVPQGLVLTGWLWPFFWWGVVITLGLCVDWLFC